MPRAKAFIPVSKGIDQRLDERLRTPDSLGVLTNAQYIRNNAVRKRHGFSLESTDIVSFDPAQSESSLAAQGTPRSIFSTGTELCVRGFRSLYALAGGKWYNKGPVSPFTGKQTTPFVGAKNYSSSDCASYQDTTFHVATTQELTTSLATTAFDTSFVFQVAKDGKEVVPSTVIGSYSGIGVPRYNSARVVKPAAGLLTALYIPSVQKQNVASNDVLEFFQSDGLTVSGPWLTINDMVGDVAEQGSFARHDSCPMNSPSVNSKWAFAYCKQPAIGASSIYVAICTDTTINNSVLIPQPGMDQWKTCAIAYGSTADALWVVGQTDNGFARLYKVTPSTMAVTAVPLTFSGSGYAAGCAVVEGTFDSANQVVVGLNFGAAGSPSVRTLDIVVTNGVATTGTAVVYNTYGVSKPWFHETRCYIAARSRYGQANGLAAGDTSNDDGYSGDVILDCFGLRPNPTVGVPEVQPHVVGRYNFGVAHEFTVTNTVSGEWDVRRGAFANVTHAASETTKYRYATDRIVQKVPNQAPVKSGDLIEVDFAGTMLQGATTRGAATIGGGSVGWYAGRRVEELGYASGPFIYSFQQNAGVPGTIKDGTYTYVGVFECYDEQGNLVRSVPGPPAKYTVAGGGVHYVTIRFYNLGPTDRFIDGKQFKVAVYRAGSDGVFYRCLRPIANSTVLNTQAQTGQIIDLGDSYDPIYTQSGAELEAAGPDGAAYSVTTSQRVWLAGFFRRDRVQYSKLYNAATANEYAIAPEFNDAFAYLTPGGQTVTGLAEMDDKVIVFTNSSIYAIAGNGPDDGGRNNDFSGLQLINSDTGCIEPRSIVSFPGGVMFRAPSGIFILGRDFQLSFLGSQVRDITDEYTETTSACLVPEANHIRFTLRKNGSESVILCYDLDQGAWLKWEPKRAVLPNPVPMNIVGSCLHQNVYYVLDASGRVYYEDETTYKDQSVYVPMSIETSWLQGAEQSGWQRVRTVAALCKSADPHDLTISVYQDFSATPSQSYTWNAATISSQKLNELVELRTSTQKCTAFKIAISDAASASSVTGEGYQCAGFQVELTGKEGLYKPGTQQRN